MIVVGDTEPPIVIAPPDITVGITTDAGAKASDDDDLAAFLVHSYAGDLLDITPTFLGAQAGGQDIGNDFAFPIGVTPVTFRWRDHAANVGSATATVTVLAHQLEKWHSAHFFDRGGRFGKRDVRPPTLSKR